MTSLFKKLNFKNHPQIVVLNAPESFNLELDEMKPFTKIVTRIPKSIDFMMVFVTKQSEIDKAIEQLFPAVDGDAILWFCYPKGTSKKYTCDFNRDNGWDKVKALGMDTVRSVAIDEDWTGLRFRKEAFIGR